jgi:hypothetical protein
LFVTCSNGIKILVKVNLPKLKKLCISNYFGRRENVAL